MKGGQHAIFFHPTTHPITRSYWLCYVILYGFFCSYYSLNSDYSSSFLYSRISPGWQSSALQMPSSVENLTPFTLPVFIFYCLTLEMPTFSASSFRDILRSAIILSSLSIIAIVPSFIVSRRIRSGARSRSQREEPQPRSSIHS